MTEALAFGAGALMSALLMVGVMAWIQRFDRLTPVVEKQIEHIDALASLIESREALGDDR